MKVKVEIEVDLSEDWIELVTNHNDLFNRKYCGYWAYGMEHDDTLGWLVHEHDDQRTVAQVSQHPEYHAIVDAWRSGAPLPEGWYRFNKDTAVKAWCEGMKMYGYDWYEKVGDCETFDNAIQMALLGELRYG